eukprot:SM000011S18974  [mRNA]  locus=s11:97216:97861:- [translate_table: standard]
MEVSRDMIVELVRSCLASSTHPLNDAFGSRFHRSLKSLLQLGWSRLSMEARRWCPRSLAMFSSLGADAFSSTLWLLLLFLAELCLRILASVGITTSQQIATFRRAIQK